MIDNDICPYCRKPMIKAENQSNSRSVEHLIPNAVLTRKRKNDEGDFYACRTCNSRKSNIDYVLGVVAKSQSVNEKLALDTLTEAISKNKNKGRAKRFTQMVRSAEAVPGGISMEIPIKGEELIEYIHFLGKGQFFKANDIIYEPSKYVMFIEFVNKQILAPLEKSYESCCISNPFQDLRCNSFAEDINNGDCIIWSKGNRFLFIFHNYTAIIVEIKKRNATTIAEAKKKESYILKHFDYSNVSQKKKNDSEKIT